MDANKRESITNHTDERGGHFAERGGLSDRGRGDGSAERAGHGLHEKPYENALVVEFALAKIPCEQQRRFPVIYKTVTVSEYVPDLIAFGTVIVDTKVIDRITDHERGQMLNYLRITGLQLGLILNFRRAKLEWERIVLSDHSR